MSIRRAWPAALPLALAACALPANVQWARSERLSLAPGKDFARCTAAAVAGLPGLAMTESLPMKQYFDDYLVLGGPPVERLADMVGDLSLRGSTIQVEFTSRKGKLPDAATREATDKLVADLAARVASQCS
jgi:hypothetical protein